jgi:hypothetical protein
MSEQTSLIYKKKIFKINRLKKKMQIKKAWIRVIEEMQGMIGCKRGRAGGRIGVKGNARPPFPHLQIPISIHKLEVDWLNPTF